MDGKKILVVDDDAICGKSVFNFSKKKGIEADVASSGKEAIDKIKANPSGYFLVMIDLYMPDMDGYQTAKELKSIAGGNLGKLVVMSGGKLMLFLYYIYIMFR
jgi:DNA-binding response OmpR family regulator